MGIRGQEEGQGFAFGRKDAERPVKHLNRMDLDRMRHRRLAQKGASVEGPPYLRGSLESKLRGKPGHGG